jgi:hypothetical protein
MPSTLWSSSFCSVALGYIETYQVRSFLFCSKPRSLRKSFPAKGVGMLQGKRMDCNVHNFSLFSPILSRHLYIPISYLFYDVASASYFSRTALGTDEGISCVYLFFISVVLFLLAPSVICLSCLFSEFLGRRCPCTSFFLPIIIGWGTGAWI